MTGATTLFEKIWAEHLVAPETADTPAVLYIDLHLIHEVTTPQAFGLLKERGLQVRRPDLTLATMDHSTPTVPIASFKDLTIAVGDSAARQVRQMQENCREFGLDLLDFDSDERGIVHVIGPELGATQPGKTIVCGDSHTSTHGAFGALAFGIGTTEVGHVLATQCLLQRQPRTLAVDVSGRLPTGVTSKDLILAIIGRMGVDGGTGHVMEYRGEAISAMDMEARMTICNMSIEAGARAGMIAPDDRTFDYLHGRPRAPQGQAWDAAVARWRRLRSHNDATFDATVTISADDLQPMVTFGTNPGMVIGINEPVPDDAGDPTFRKALDYLQVVPGRPLIQTGVDVVFVGSCTNSRLSDLQLAADILRNRKIADHVRMLVVPGSQAVKAEAEALGLDEVFVAAGAEWREPGCSMCLGGRQGIGARTVLASPLTAAASAIAGHIADPRPFLN
jgi:3-isopropylmalate/(R)-2-methylmalate dehydratase large subunit